MSDHLSRKELKQDNVALKVEETAHFLSTHRPQVIKAGVAVLAVLVVGLGAWFFISSRRDARAQALASAIGLQSTAVGQTTPNGQTFATEQAKSEAVRKAFNAIVTQDEGTNEGAAAEYFLAGIDVTEGKLTDAVKKYDHVASSAGADYASLAKLAKAQVQFSLGNVTDASAVLKDLIANPTAMVSKDQATIALAHGLAPTQPEEARKLLTPIASAQSDVSQAATSALAELPSSK